jgi:hypothetical protein
VRGDQPDALWALGIRDQLVKTFRCEGLPVEPLWERGIWEAHGPTGEHAVVSDERRARDVSLMLAVNLAFARVVLWEPNVWDLAGVGWEAVRDGPPPDVVCLQEPELWLLRQRLIYEPTDPNYLGLPDRCHLVGVALMPAVFDPNADHLLVKQQDPTQHRPTGLQATLFFQPIIRVPRDPTLPVAIRAPSQTLPWWRPMPSIFAHQPRCDVAADLVARLAFLETRIVDRCRLDIPRAERRRANRESRRIPVIQSIVLRRPEGSPSAEEGTGRDWSCRWSVRGHWRRQWHGQVQPRKLAYIHSYVKGPADKPYQPPRPTIFHAKR